MLIKLKLRNDKIYTRASNYVNQVEFFLDILENAHLLTSLTWAF